jgi:hypothetical protein
MDGSAIFTLGVGAVVLFLTGGAWMALYWRILDPRLRQLLGRLLGVQIYLGEQNIWQINDDSVDSVDWRNMLVRPIQIISLMMGALIPLVVTIIVLVALLPKPQ